MLFEQALHGSIMEVLGEQKVGEVLRTAVVSAFADGQFIDCEELPPPKIAFVEGLDAKTRCVWSQRQSRGPGGKPSLFFSRSLLLAMARSVSSRNIYRSHPGSCPSYGSSMKLSNAQRD